MKPRIHMANISTLFVRVISLVSGKPYDPTQIEKTFYIFQGLAAAALFVIFFSYLYHRYFWKNRELKKLFFWCVGLTLALVLAKYSLNYFRQTYLIERLLFFALPSPRLESIGAFLSAIGIFAIFLRLRAKIEQLPTRYFIVVITTIFILFTLSVASMRIGVEGIAKPFTFHRTEFTGALQFARPIGLKNFLTQFDTLVPVLPLHAATHPPGYVVFLYLVEQMFNVGDFGLAVAVVVVSTLAIGLLYIFWESLYGRDIARRMAQILIFVPSWVLFTATSMDALNYFIVWLAIIACFFGWKRSYFLSFAAGLTVGYAVFSNYLFVFMVPLFLSLLWFSMKEADSASKRGVVFRVATSLAAFGLFFLSLWLWTRYSIITNFFAGHAYWQAAIIDFSIENNVGSLGTYFVFSINNLTPFIWYLGAPIMIYLLRNVKISVLESDWWFKIGLVVLALFTFTGLILGGETERILLFMVPFFLMFRFPLYNKANTEKFNAVLCLMFFQIMVFQIAFHTYW